MRIILDEPRYTLFISNYICAKTKKITIVGNRPILNLNSLRPYNNFIVCQDFPGRDRNQVLHAYNFRS